MAMGKERELYSGEQHDIIMHALTLAKNNVHPNGRVRTVLQALTDANQPVGEGERLKASLRDAVSNCTNIGLRERRALEDLGFSISEEGKHLKLVFRGDDRYTFAMPKSGSDWRGMKNWVSDTSKILFK